VACEGDCKETRRKNKREDSQKLQGGQGLMLCPGAVPKLPVLFLKKKKDIQTQWAPPSA